MEFQIRAAEEQDFPSLIVLFREFAAFEKVPERMTNDLELIRKEQPFFNGFVVEYNGSLIGYAAYFFCYFTWTGKAMYLDDLYVKPEFRGHKIGSSLLNRVIELARETGCHKIRWQVSRWNEAAIDFYRKVGASIDDVEWNCDLTVD